ncbi:Hypothetical protein D9617_1g084320 [Elsinoe fawcettii]|nr:Hypothetical protein D9617_1g084320 [Elsinoe fawcettii]
MATMTATMEVPSAVNIPLQSRNSAMLSSRVNAPSADVASPRSQHSIYSRFTRAQKKSISLFVAYCGLLASMSTTSILAAVPEIIDTFNTTTTVINISNALYLVT